MKGITIIIPTMLYFPEMLNTMLERYSDIPEVKEILIINNTGSDVVWTYEKARELSTGENMFVCPSWNLGVEEAKTDKIIIANDDIVIDEVERLIQVMSEVKEGFVMGLAPSCYSDNNPAPDRVSGITYGFGVFMAMHTKTYTPIPKEFKVWYGDTIQWKESNTITISGFKVKTPMAGTSSKLNLKKERKTERKAFNKLYQW